MEQPRNPSRDNAGSHRIRWWGIATTVCAAALAIPATPAQAITETFSYTGGEQQFVVPTGVYRVKVDAIGGIGGAATTALGGEAADVVSGLSVTPAQTLYIEVGGKGKSLAEGGTGGFNGGAGGAGGGGGASDIRTSPRASGLSPDTRLLIAAGGGGAGGDGPLEPGGAGGNAESNGGTAGYEGGGAGTQTEGGLGSLGCNVGGENGVLGLGGAGGDSEEESDPGGGGGGGLFGGGGGGGACLIGSGGGGGGSSLVSEGLTSLTTGEPKIEIKYNPPPSVTITTPVDEAAYPQGKSISSSYSCLAGEGTTVKSCTGPVADGSPMDTSTPGEHTFTIQAEDNDSGKASKSVSYTVIRSPSIEIGSPTNATYTKDQIVTASYACQAGEGAELKSCDGPVASGSAIDTAIVGPHSFTVVAKDDVGGETSKTVDYTVAASASSSTTPPPDTILSTHPKKTIKTKKKKAKVKFSFSSDTAGASFQCKLDKGPFTPCTSPKTYKVKRGKHTFSVEAVSAAGTDPSPATYSFKVKKKK